MGFTAKLGQLKLGQGKLGNAPIESTQDVHLGFIESTSVVYPLTVQSDTFDVPFIPSTTVVYPIASVWRTGTGPGNGGELFYLQLAPTGGGDTVLLDGAVTSSSPSLTFASPISGLVPDVGFVVTINNEVIYVSSLSEDGLTAYGLHRGMSNTSPASHADGASVVWDDTYEMAVESTSIVPESFTYNGVVYEAWLIAADSSQGYLGGDRYPSFVAEFTGVFPPGGHTTGNKVDSAQPSAAHAPAAVSDDCPAAITVPALLTDSVDVGDVVLLTYVNTEASVLVLGPRSALVQSWYGFGRKDAFNNDVTNTDPSGTVVDAAADDQFFEEEFVTVTMPGLDRTFTYGPPRFSDKGWPIGVIAVRQGLDRIPLWTSPNWHNFSYVYAGFAVDATFVQVLINRNNAVYDDADPTIALPGPQDIDGPNATWDDTAGYYTSTAWYVGILKTGASLIAGGPPVNGTPQPPNVPPSPTIIPVVTPGGTGGGGGGTYEPPVIPPEGGSGGDISPPQAETVQGVFFDPDLLIAPFDGKIDLD